MNRDEMIDAIVKAYMGSIMCENLEDWIEKVIRYGRMDKGLDDKGLENMTDEELKRQYDDWIGWDEDTTEEDK